jgi:hypothetical protein
MELIMNSARHIGVVAVALLFGACSHFASTKIEYVPASDVVNAVKTELANVIAQPEYSIAVQPGDCGSANRVYVHLSDASVDVSLKTVRTKTNSPVASLAGGAIASVLVSGSHTWTNTNIQTQQTTYSLKLEPPRLTEEGAKKLGDRHHKKIGSGYCERNCQISRPRRSGTAHR